jgi:hypothetical protein
VEEWVTLAVFLTGNIVGFFLKAFFLPFFGEKGKNLATKQDIEDITKKVESVKALITISTQQQLNLFAKRNEALTQFFEESSKALVFLRSPFHYSFENFEGLDKHIMEGQEHIIRALTSYYRLVPYVQDESLTSPVNNTFTVLNTLQKTWPALMIEYRNAFDADVEQWELAKITGEVSYFEHGRPSDQVLSKISQDITGLLNTVEDSLIEYGKALKAHFHSVDKSKALVAMPET